MGKDAVIVRSYKAKNQPAAAREFANDAKKLAKQGYRPIAQSWEEGKTGLARLVVTGGISAFALKPKGSLTVTYQLETAAPAPIIVQAPAAAPTPTPPAPAKEKPPKPEGPRVEGEYWR